MTKLLYSFVITFVYIFSLLLSIQFVPPVIYIKCLVTVEKLMAKLKNQAKNVSFNKNVFDLNQKHLQVFQAFFLLKNTRWNAKNLIKIFKFFIYFSRFAQALGKSKNQENLKTAWNYRLILCINTFLLIFLTRPIDRTAKDFTLMWELVFNMLNFWDNVSCHIENSLFKFN